MQLNRRDWLMSLTGFGGLALTHLLAAEETPTPRKEFNGGLHHRAKVRRVVQVFLNGGMSQMDTFDYKPSSKNGTARRSISESRRRRPANRGR